jgi:signal transduction histidine kinase
MDPRSVVRRRTRPPLVSGILVAVLCVVAETLLAEALERFAPGRSLGIVFLLGIVAVASVWGVWLGMATAAVSTLAFDYFLIPPVGRLNLDKSEDWAVLAVYLAVTLLSGSISTLGRSLAAEADARREAALSAELARILLQAPDLATARPAAAKLLARALTLSSASIEFEEPSGEDDRVALSLHDRDVPVAWLLVPAGLPGPVMRRLRERIVPSMEVLLRAACERQRIMVQQVALRRLATLIAHRSPPEEVFAAVAREVGQVLDIPHVLVTRYEPGDVATNVGVWNRGGVATLPLGTRFLVEKGTAAEVVARTEGPGRIGPADLAAGTGEVLTALRTMGIRFAAGCPIMVGGRPWGAVIGASVADPLPPDTEERLLDFTDLLVTAIVNAESHAALEASRARVLAAADATRRLIERDLHDGTQQRLVALMLELRTMAADPPQERRELKRLLSRTTRSLDQVIADLRGIARGLHPALLSRLGLEPAIKALARCSRVPVELNVCTGRLGERSEVTAYHVVCEGLTNAGRHANASVVHVDLAVEDSSIRLSIRDDGTGGADLRRGKGLLAIRDRVEALGGRLEITSPPGAGTSLFAEFPVADDA